MAVDVPKRGDPLTREKFRAEAEAINANAVRGTWPVVVDTGSEGAVVGLDVEGLLDLYATRWIEIRAVGTGAQAGLYGWRGVRGDGTPTGWEVVEGAEGTLSPLKDPFVEANNYAGLAVGTKIEVRRERRTGRLVAQLEKC